MLAPAKRADRSSSIALAPTRTTSSQTSCQSAGNPRNRGVLPAIFFKGQRFAKSKNLVYNCFQLNCTNKATENFFNTIYYARRSTAKNTAGRKKIL